MNAPQKPPYTLTCPCGHKVTAWTEARAMDLAKSHIVLGTGHPVTCVRMGQHFHVIVFIASIAKKPHFTLYAGSDAQ